MSGRRRYVLGGAFLALVAVAAVLLRGVLGTVFLGLTVAYLLAPIRRRLRSRGFSRRASATAATLAAFVGLVAVVSPLAAIVFLRLEDVLAGLRAAPDTVTVEALGYVYAVELAVVTDAAVDWLVAVARAVAAAAPALSVKLALFVLLLYSLLYHEGATRRAVYGVVPPSYRDFVEALHGRARETLYAIYVLQVATAVGTFVVALPFFTALGYPAPVALAVAAGVLQFVPVVGPVFLLAGLAAYHVVTGDVAAAVFVFVLGNLLVSWLPDLLIRPQLARRTARMPGSLYFVGFIGGLLSLGAIGVIAGPLAVALVVEAGSWVSDELYAVQVERA